MTTTQTLADRIRETIDGDSPYVVSGKLAEQGVMVTPQAIYRWLDSSDVKEENLSALARAYRVSEAWLRYGHGQKRTLTDSQLAAASLFDELPTETAQRSLDFLEFELHRASPLLAQEKMAHYMTWIDHIRADLEAKKRKDG